MRSSKADYFMIRFVGILQQNLPPFHGVGLFVLSGLFHDPVLGGSSTKSSRPAAFGGFF